MFFGAKPSVSAPTAPVKSATYTCSFCKKSHHEVRKLITGPGVNICDGCVLICKDLLDKQKEREEVALANG